MDRIKIITLIFALSFCTANSYACYDDDDDDWYSYDNFYDDDNDDDDCDNEDYILLEEDVYMKTVELDEVVVIGSTSSNDDDDWWRRYEFYDNGDDDEGYGYDDGVVAIGYGDGDQNKDKYKEIEAKKAAAKNKQFLAQSCQFCCVPAVLANMKMYAGNLSLQDAVYLEKQYKQVFSDWQNGKDISDLGVRSDQIREYIGLCGFSTSLCTIEGIEQCTNEGMQVFVFLDAYSESGEKYGHALDIIDTNNNEGKAVSYECINPATGRVETYTSDAFNAALILRVQ